MIAVTTCRKPHVLTRGLARALASLLPDSKYVVRGKKSVDDLIEGCRAEGLPRLAIIGESHGNPARAEFLSITGDDWAWDDGVLLIRGAEVIAKTRGTDGLRVAGPLARSVAGLLGVEEMPGAGAEMRGEAGQLAFVVAGKVMLRMKVEVVSHEARDAGRDAEGRH